MLQSSHRCLKVLSSIWKESLVHLRSVALCEVGIIICIHMNMLILLFLH